MGSIGAAIADPDSAGILVYGAAGVGKSRVAREALTAATSQGCVVRWVVGTTAGQGVPLGALASWAEPEEGGSLQLVRAAIEALTAAGPDGGAVIVGVDDVNLLDDLSVFALQ